MATIANRLVALVDALPVSGSEFARRIGITPQYISRLRSHPEANISDSVIINIVREFSVNEVWLRDGVGEMFLERTIEDEIDAFCGSIKKLEKDDPRWCVMRLLAKLPEEDWDAIADMIKLIKEEN